MKLKKAVVAEDIGKIICAIAGLDPRDVRKVTLELQVGQPALLIVEQYTDASTSDLLQGAVAGALKRYTLNELVDSYGD